MTERCAGRRFRCAPLPSVSLIERHQGRKPDAAQQLDLRCIWTPPPCGRGAGAVGSLFGVEGYLLSNRLAKFG